MNGQTLRLQTWLIWGLAASFPVMMGRNPFVLALISLIVAVVAVTYGNSGRAALGGRVLVRTAAFIAIFTVLFNVLTARTGNQVIVEIPNSWWVLSGSITWNAVLYGMLSAWALVCLIAIWMTVGGHVNWASLARILPERLAGFAVAGSTAINLIPQTSHAYQEIREATTARGFSLSGARGIATLVTPVINGGVDRSMRMAEVLESRGFGSRTDVAPERNLREQVGWMLLLGGGFVAIYGLSAGVVAAAAGALVASLAGLLLLREHDQTRIKRTRFRDEPLAPTDWFSIFSCLMAMVLTAIASTWSPDTFRYEPYPDIGMPAAHALALAPLLLLAIPALLVKRPSND